MRTPALDSYFAFTANLGTHTFFMVFLPMLFWSGYTTLGRAYVNLGNLLDLVGGKRKIWDKRIRLTGCFLVGWYIL